MTVTYCDCCGKIIEERPRNVVTIHTGTDGTLYELCNLCLEKMLNYLNELKTEEAKANG